jgi:predicted O-methyltransferase YrrM
LGGTATARVAGVNTTTSQGKNLTLTPLDCNLKAFLKKYVPPRLWTALRKSWEKLHRLNRIEPVRRINRRLLKLAVGFMAFDAEIVRIFNEHGFNITQTNDFYSPLPSVSGLQKTVDRWSKPSELIGIDYRLSEMKARLQHVLSKYGPEYQKKTNHKEIGAKGYGPGFPVLDSMLLYSMVRHKKPQRYLEIGSGVSTYFCRLAAEENLREGDQTEITCIDPYPQPALVNIPEVNIIKKEVQDAGTSDFERLNPGDILFIDSTHIVKLDGDVPFLYLEVLPRLKKGVIIHVHDIHFPYNSPYPHQYYVFGQKRPVFWTEAMLLQTFLSFNDAYRILLSTPLIRHFDEPFLKALIPGYTPVNLQDANTHAGSIWIERVK